jgi:hypothetical protein
VAKEPFVSSLKMPLSCTYSSKVSVMLVFVDLDAGQSTKKMKDYVDGQRILSFIIKSLFHDE